MTRSLLRALLEYTTPFTARMIRISAAFAVISRTFDNGGRAFTCVRSIAGSCRVEQANALLVCGF